MQRDANRSSSDGMRVPCARDGSRQAIPMEAIPMEDARSKEQVRRQGSPLRKQYRQQVSNQLASSSDDDSGGLDYDTDDSALRDYMDNVAEQDQGGFGTAALAFARGIRQPHIDQMYAYGSSSSLDEEDQSTPPTHRIQPPTRHGGAVAVPQRVNHRFSGASQPGALLSSSAPVSIPARRATYHLSPLQHTAESPLGCNSKPPLGQHQHGGRSWSPTVDRGRRISTGSLGGSQSRSRAPSDDGELSRRAGRAQQRRRVAPQSRFNRQRFDVDRAPSLDSKSARKTSWLREAALAIERAGDGAAGGGWPAPTTVEGRTSGPGGAATAQMHALPRQAGMLDHPDLSQRTSKQRKKLLQRERRAVRAAQAGFDPVAIADDLLLFAECSYDGSLQQDGNAGGEQSAGPSDRGESEQWQAPHDSRGTASIEPSPERPSRMQCASPPFAGANVGSSKRLMITCGGSPAGCTWAEKAAKVCGLGARIVGKRGRQSVEVWRDPERATGRGRGQGGKGGHRRWTGGRKGVLDNEARSELDGLVASAVKEIQQGSAVDGIVTTFGVTRIDGGSGKASAGGAGASKKGRADRRKAKLPFGQPPKEGGYANAPLAFVSGGVIAEDAQQHVQAHALTAPRSSVAGTPAECVADACMQELQHSDMGAERDADTCMHSISSAPRDDADPARGLLQPPSGGASSEPPSLLGFATRRGTDHMCGPSGVVGGEQLSGLGFNAKGEEARVCAAADASRSGVAISAGALTQNPEAALAAGAGATAGVVEPRRRPQPRSQLGQLRPVLVTARSSPDDTTFMHTGLGFAGADGPAPSAGGPAHTTSAATAEQMIPASTVMKSSEPHCATGATEADSASGAALNGGGEAAQQPEVPLFDMDMPVLGQHCRDRGAPDSAGMPPLSQKTRRELAITQLGPDVVVDRTFAESFVAGRRPNDTAALAKRAQKKAKKEARRAAQRDEGNAGPSTRSPHNAPAENTFGAFERHTKGIGAKLLKNWGYQEGQGLGKNSQGIINPVQAQKWDKRTGIGNQ